MPSEFVIELLKRWYSGRKLNRNQYAELINDGLLIQLEPDTYALTKHGRDILHPNK